jgi:hypothetical protein
MIQMISAITITTARIPTTAPALKMPAIAVQLLNKTATHMKAAGKTIFFISDVPVIKWTFECGQSLPGKYGK